MLTGIGLVAFKSFAEEAAPIAPFTLLVGPNASGKSNTFDAIRFLQGVGLDLPIADVLGGRTDGGHVTWPGIRGGAKEVARSPARRFRIRTQWDLDGKTVVHAIRCSVDPEPHVTDEYVWVDGLAQNEYLFSTHTTPVRSQAAVGASVVNATLDVTMKRAGKGDDISAVYSSAKSLLGQIEPRPHLLGEVTDVARRLRAAMRSVLFLEPNPARMRAYAPVFSTSLGAHGENISAILYKLCQEPERKRQIVSLISELCAPTIVDIEFSRTDEDFVLFRLVEKDGTRISAFSVSDGALRALGEIVAIMTLPSGGVMLVEEIGASLHPACAELLVETIEAQIAKGDRQVIATSHSPTLLSALSKEHLEDVIAFGRSPEAAGTLMQRLGDLPHFEEMKSKRGITQLFRTKTLKRVL